MKAILAVATVAALAMVAKSGEPTNHVLTAAMWGTSSSASETVLKDGTFNDYYPIYSPDPAVDFIEADFGVCKAIATVALLDIWEYKEESNIELWLQDTDYATSTFADSNKHCYSGSRNGIMTMAGCDGSG